MLSPVFMFFMILLFVISSAFVAFLQVLIFLGGVCLSIFIIWKFLLSQIMWIGYFMKNVWIAVQFGKSIARFFCGFWVAPRRRVINVLAVV